MNFNSIGYFQFDNLMQSRIPLVLLLLGEFPLKTWYNSIVGMHLDNVSVNTTPAKALSAVQDKKLPLHFAVVVLDHDASTSPTIVQALEDLGYINAYYVQGGWNSLVAERQNAKL